jgi:DHA2 family multidrug resistance protein
VTATIGPAAPGSTATWAGFAALCLGMFMAILDIQIVSASLPEIATALDIAPDRMSWVQTAYLIAEVIAIPLSGWLTRVLTLRGLFCASIAAFTLASVGCAASGGFASLVAWRVLQGFAGGALIPIVFTAVFVLLDKRHEALATTIAGGLAVLAPTLGPTVGGFVTQTYSWHWLFLINLAPGVLAFCVGAACLRRDAPDLALARSLDGVSLAALCVALASLEIGLKEAPQGGWTSAPVLGALALFLAAGTFFVRRTLRARHPVVSLRLMHERGLALGCALSFLTGIGLYGSVYLMPVFLAFVRDHGPLAIGRTMLVTGLAQLVAAPLVVLAERRINASILALAGFTAFAVGLALSAFDTRETDFEEMIVPQLVRGAAIMLCLLAPTRVALGHLAAADIPDGSALFNVMRNLGGAIGIALIDTVIFTRTPRHAALIVDRLTAGDRATALAIGVPETALSASPPLPGDPALEALVQPLVERASLVLAIDEAWAMMAALVLLGPVLVLAARPRRPGR